MSAYDTAEQTGGLDFYGAAERPAKSETRTLPPSKADEDARAFETLIKKVGESKVRWTHVLERAEELFHGGRK